MKYPKQHFVLLLILLHFNLTRSAGNILDHQEEQESEELENALVKNVQKDFQNGFIELFNFVNAINNNITALKREISLQKGKIDGQKSEILDLQNTTADQKSEILDLKYKTADQKSKILDLKTKTAHQKPEILDLKNKITNQISEKTRLNASLMIQQKQIRELKQAVSNLYHRKLNLSWEGFDEFIRSIEPEVKTGNSFNGSTLSVIKLRASEVGMNGSYTVVVFANHMDEAIQDFQIHDPYSYTNNPAPKSVPPHTQEVFTFAKSSYYARMTSFSYFIPSAGIRIAAYSGNGVYAGLAFISNDTNMKTYYDNKKGIEGSWMYELKYITDQNLSVSYKNFQARLFAKDEGHYKATLRIELIKLPL